VLKKLNSGGGEMEISVDVNSVCCVVARTYILYLLLLDIVIGGLLLVCVLNYKQKKCRDEKTWFLVPVPVDQLVRFLPPVLLIEFKF